MGENQNPNDKQNDEQSDKKIDSKNLANMSVTDLNDFSDLKKYMRECIAQKKPLQINIKEIISSMIEWIKKDDSLTHFQDCLECLNTLKQFEKSSTNAYKTYENDLARTLDAYIKKLNTLIKDESESAISNISQFFTVYQNDTKLNALKLSMQSTLNPFSALYGVQSAFASINKSRTYFMNLKTRTDSERSQRAYSQLLGDILEGEQTVQALLPLMREQSGEQQEENRELLSKDEFPVPTGEPEHPKYVGFNDTMNFNPEELKAITDLFTTEDLKHTFLDAFPWSANLENVDFIEEAEAIPHINLLGTPILLEPKVQLAIIKFALLSLDTISKLAGYDGQLTIHNFDLIKEISDKLQGVSELLAKLDVNNTKGLAKHLETITTNLKVQNKAYYHLRKDPDAAIKIQLNPNMNGFCHINEVLVHVLTGVEFLKSVLTPKHPRAQVAEKISQALEQKGTQAVFQIAQKSMPIHRAHHLTENQEETFSELPKKKIKTKKVKKPKKGKAS